MIITTTMTLVNGVYKTVVTTEATSIETALMAAYGEPTIDQLGVIPFILPNTSSSSFTLTGGPLLVKIRSGMPISFALDSNIDALAVNKVTGWGVEMKNRIASVLATLKALPLLQQPEVTHYEA